MIVLGGYQVLLDVIKFYLLVIILLGGGLIFWARINQWRFKDKNSRTYSSDFNEDAMHEFFDIDNEKLCYLQTSTSSKVSLNEEGAIENIAR